MNGEQLQGTLKVAWKKLKVLLKLKHEERRVEKYKVRFTVGKTKDVTSAWSVTSTRKTEAVIEVQEQMVETRTRKAMRGEEVMSENYRLCSARRETVNHWLSDCAVLTGSEYVQRHNKALIVLAVEWAKQAGLLEESTVWYKITWQKGTTLENQRKKLIWTLSIV